VSRCECCQEESKKVYPVPDLNNPDRKLQQLVCFECADLILEEHTCFGQKKSRPHGPDANGFYAEPSLSLS
jgi:hypothetical protein